MRYTANPDELRKLAGGLTNVAGQLGPTHRLDRASSVGLGSPDVARTLDQVSGNWSQARRRLRGDLEHLATAVEAAAGSYVAADGSPFAVPTSAGAGR